MKGFTEVYYKNLTKINTTFFESIGKFSYYLLLLLVLSPGWMWFHSVVFLSIVLLSPLVLGIIWVVFLIPSSVIFISLPTQYLHTPMLSEPEADTEAGVI